MNRKRWHRFKKVVAAVLEQERRQWPSRLLEECGDDVDLFLDVSSLLALSRSAGGFIEAPAWHMLRSPATARSEGAAAS